MQIASVIDFDDSPDPDSLQKLEIVAYHQQGSVVGIKGLGELLDARDIKIVGRLVEDQQLCGGLCEEQSCERNPEAFAT